MKEPNDNFIKKVEIVSELTGESPILLMLKEQREVELKFFELMECADNT